MAFGVVLSIHSHLGTSPISSVPYSFSFIIDLSVGQLTILLHIIMILTQALLLGKSFQWYQYLQLPIGIAFGGLIDALMWLTNSWSIQAYSLQLVLCLLSCVVTAIGVFLMVKANLIFLAGEGLYSAISQRFKIEFGKCKIYGDIALVMIAVIAGLSCLGKVIGVREGTFICALSVGYIVRLLLANVHILKFESKPKPTEN
ncbi:hypothetical protein A3K93_12810 [Acinetobacter sp. NCu2D-2]|uniref:YczE/YyaS/YitT family protein n=1 Tax=Acinetobacter sp. NCu2D-2 TaxID=1608473 RepID=UPI0007CDA812|nr:DUF6198 family protein [Acinetobacter sp. NCu2D-2]ANF82983.1 hypothetical protein A3K93_12810 [Acinetobacter sp. NCu2D-2]